MRPLIILISIVLGLGLAGCGTVVPRAVESTMASFDGNAHNSGVLAALPTGYLVTSRLRDRYNALICEYGADFRPALSKDAGLTKTPEGWVLDREHMVKFLEMNAWRRAQLAPQSK